MMPIRLSGAFPLAMVVSVASLAAQNPAPSGVGAKTDYSAPRDAPYASEKVVVPTPRGYTLAGTLKHDPSATARRVRSPGVLIMTGANDQQANPKEVTQWAASFYEAGNRDLTAIVVPEVNHLFVYDTDGFPGGYAMLPPPVVMQPSVIGTIVDWLAHRLR